MPSPSARRRPVARRMLGAARAAEALVLVVAFAGAQRCVPMTRWSRVLGAPVRVPAEVVEGAGPTRFAPADPLERQVAAAVGRVRRVLPFQPSCLAQAAAGQVMLRARREPGTVLIGLRRAGAPDGPEGDGGAWAAHAWLLGSGGVILGGAAGEGYTPTTAFRPLGGRRTVGLQRSAGGR